MDGYVDCNAIINLGEAGGFWQGSINTEFTRHLPVANYKGGGEHV